MDNLSGDDSDFDAYYDPVGVSSVVDFGTVVFLVGDTLWYGVVRGFLTTVNVLVLFLVCSVRLYILFTIL